MRVFINAFSARQGGGQTYLYNLLQYLPEKSGIEVILAAPVSLELPAYCNNIERLNSNWPVENPFIRTCWEIVVLPRLLRKMEIEVLFSPGGVIVTKAPSGCKSVTMFRNMMPFDLKQRRKYPLGYMRLRNWILQRVMMRSMFMADLVIFISDYAKQVIKEYSNDGLQRTVVIPHGINPIFRQVVEQNVSRPDWLPSDEYFLYVSILDVYKDQLELVRGYFLLKQQRPEIGKLVLIGPDFTEYAHLVRREIRRLGLNSDIFILGEVPYGKLMPAYRHAKVNIFASECENCPNILLEALAAGRPLLVSKCPPMPEFGGKAVVYFDPTSPEDFAEKMDFLLQDPLRLEIFAKLACMRSLQYDWQRTAIRTWNAILKLDDNNS
jgi:glycosyltransferase involved in cell wall biosynthesis